MVGSSVRLAGLDCVGIGEGVGVFDSKAAISACTWAVTVAGMSGVGSGAVQPARASRRTGISSGAINVFKLALLAGVAVATDGDVTTSYRQDWQPVSG